MKYVDVVIDNKSEYMDSFFTYMAPDYINVGDKVTIPLARKQKGAEGYVVSIDTVPGIEADKVKEIIGIDKDRSLTPEIIDTAIWMKSRYGVKYIDAIRMFDVTGKRVPKQIKAYDETKLEDEPTLSEEQKYAVLDICNSIDNQLGKSFLIHGVTNSGKTEVYIRAVKSAIARGKSAIVLVPEIALSSQIAERFSKRFGKEQVAIMHSKLKTSERLAEWMRIKSGEAKIVVGARTAVFAPASDIGVIIIDEEHESTYKSDHNPKFETVDVAFRRAKYHNATLVLGSATPSIVSYNRAMDGIYQLIEMKNRIGNSIMPEVQIVDMRDELRSGNSSIISRKLLASITQTVKDGDQVILFLNRRGFSTQVLCPECGYIMMCPDCDITLTYHKKENAAICHYCGRKFKIPKVCPECGNNNLSFIGTGTERLEETIEELVPNAKVERFDLDTAKNSSEIKKTLRHFNSGKTNILVGTQILAKGLDFKNVGLVGIILADSSLNIPDYRSPERTFQLITQVSGRAGREGGKSKVILQTYQPEDDTIKKAANRDYYGFYEQELAHRKNMNYPPFSDIITVIFVDKKGSKTEYSSTLDHANDFRKYLLSMKNLPTGTTIYEPKLDTQRGGADRNRVIFMIKAPRGTRSGFVSAYMNYRELMIKHRSTCHIELDINPYGII
ncbi:MAG: primosomal protein N' [Mogibacterium diversum]|uniref:replication restart helicase PriA n=1 Tax=Mogibacterium diversum TaxID=114527 RepID=UPI001CB5CAC9|nr:primosomal protein N' [Mogibacterium diversum]MBF1341750.1 primosomal protein N' [Mogibacterium diversum]